MAKPQNARVFTNKQQRKAVEEGKIVESANSLQPADFFNAFCPEETLDALRERCQSHSPPLQLALSHPKDLQQRDLFESCFNLVEESSAHDYRSSEMKWSPSSKRKEMKLPDMRYIALAETAPSNTGGTPSIVGFVSFMITYEDGYEVVYVYEIHFTPQFRGKGLGKLLMNAVEDIGKRVGVEKVMLTVFQANERARKWYKSLGYEKDEFSPEARVLRNGTVKEPSYNILSKPIKQPAS